MSPRRQATMTAADEPTLAQGYEPTLLIPAPGGQATVAMKRAAAVPAQPSVDLQRLVAGINPLLEAAGTLLALVPQLRVTVSHADPEGLRRQLLLDHIARFESLAGARGVPRPKVTAARYVLCSFIDEVVCQTPWGGGSGWDRRTLLQEFHEERWGGDKAFQLLERLSQDVETNADLLELFYVCLRLGFEGRYRERSDGRAQLEVIAGRVLEMIHPAHQAALARTLSPRWEGVAVRQSGLTVLPWWVMVVGSAGLLLALWLVLGARLEAAAQPVFREIHTVPLALRVQRTETAGKPRLAPLLKDDVARGAVQVIDEPMRSVVRVPADGWFVPGSAKLVPEQGGVLQRIAATLAAVPGHVAVIGHTDDQPVVSPQFPSSWHLTRERALAVQAALVQFGMPAGRSRAEGRADAEPLAPNTDEAQRARNRRIEIELRLLRPDE
jgi:type VI secretion system protein ImpK